MYAGAAAPLCEERHTAFEASTDTSSDDHGDGSQEVPERCMGGGEICINVQNRFLRSRQQQILQLPSRQKQLEQLDVKKGVMDSDTEDQNRNHCPRGAARHNLSAELQADARVHC